MRRQGSCGAARGSPSDSSVPERGEHRRGRPERAIARAVREHAERDRAERASAEEHGRREPDGLPRAARAGELAGDRVQHAVEAERAEREEGDGRQLHGEPLPAREPEDEAADRRDQADVAQRRAAPAAAVAIGEPAEHDARRHRRERHDREQRPRPRRSRRRMPAPPER